MATAFESDDLDAIEAYLSRAYARARLRTGDPHPKARSERGAIGPAAVEDCVFDFDLDYTAGAARTLVIGSITAGTVGRHVAAGSEIRLGAGDIAVLAQPGDACEGALSHLQSTVVSLQPELLSQVASTAPGHQAQPVRLTASTPVTPAAGRILNGAIKYLRAQAFADPAGGGSPLIAASSAALMAAAVLSAFPSTALAEPTAVDRRDAHPQTLQRAIRFIDEHGSQAITLADIAAAAFVTTRAIQLAFRRHLGITPMEYLRQVRLENAHRELTETSPDDDTVTAIAYRWGFPSASRFAARYQRAYGVPPSQTLHR